MNESELNFASILFLKHPVVFVNRITKSQQFDTEMFTVPKFSFEIILDIVSIWIPQGICIA